MSELKLTDFPTEILEKIFGHFDDTTSAIATSVCKRFSEVLNETVRRKYNGSSCSKWYQIELFDLSIENESNKTVHRPFVLKRVSALKLIFHAELNHRNHWIHQVIGRIGRNIKMIRLTNPNLNHWIDVNFYDILSKTPNISHLHVDYVYPVNRKWCHQRYRNLMHLEMRLRRIFDENELKPFVKNNRQLKNVKLELKNFRLLNAFDGSKIESLECRFSFCTDKEIPVHIKPIQMSHLKSLSLELPKTLFNECVKEIVAPCRNLKDLNLRHFDDVVVTDEAMEILCAFSSLESIEICNRIQLGKIVRLIDSLPTLVSIGLWLRTFTIDDARVLLKAANRHPSLRYILLQNNMDAIFDQSLLNWLMENVNDRIQVENDVCCKLAVTKGKVQYGGVTIMNSIGTLECGKLFHKWFERIKFIATLSDRYYDFFSNLPSLRAFFDESERRTHLQLNDEMDEALIKRRGTNVTTASTIISKNYDQSVNHMNWLEKYCRRLYELTIYIEDNHQQLPVWTFPELNVFRINSRERRESVDLGLFTSFRCSQLTELRMVGFHQFSLINIQVVQDIDLFDNLVILQLFQFNESMNNLLEQFNANAQNSLRHLTLANRSIDCRRYQMNNKTIIAISKFSNLVEMKLILPGLNNTNTKCLFESCTKLSVLYLECNFLSTEEHSSLNASSSLFAGIKSNCILLKRLQLVWHNQMMDAYKVSGIKSIFPNVVIKIMQIDDRMITKAEKIIEETDNDLERLFDEIEV